MNIPRNHAWSRGLSAYLGGVRERLPGMRPNTDRTHPAGTDWPPPEALTGLVVTPSFGKGVAYLRNLRIDDTDFLFTPYWRILDFGDWLGPVGTGTPRLPLSSLLARGRGGEHRIAFDAYGVPRTIDDFEPFPAGNYVVDVEVRSRYQGGVVSATAKQVAFDPDDVANSFGHDIELPGMPGTYWLDATVRDAAGHYLYGRRMQVVVTDPAAGDDASQAAEQPRLSHAGNALIALDTGRPDHVFEAPAAVRVTARFRPPQRPAKMLRCEWTIASPQLPEPLQGGQALRGRRPRPGDRHRMPGGRGHRLLRADRASVRRRRLARPGTAAGRPARAGACRGTHRASAGLPGRLVSRPDSRPEAPWISHPVTPGGPPPTAAEQRRLFEQSLDQAAGIVGQDLALVRLSVPWDDFEPLPGLYCFHALEQRLALARAKGLRAAVFFELKPAPQWLPHEAMRGQYGIERHGTLQNWNYHAADRLASVWGSGPRAGHDGRVSGDCPATGREPRGRGLSHVNRRSGLGRSRHHLRLLALGALRLCRIPTRPPRLVAGRSQHPLRHRLEIVG